MRTLRHNADYYRDWWLKKFHNTDCATIVKERPELKGDGHWFDYYPVTELQAQEWRLWAEGEIMRDCKISKRTLRRSYWWSIELDCAPAIINENIPNGKQPE